MRNMEANVERTRKEKRFRRTRNVSLTPADERWMVAQAERFHGGNVSRYIQHLVRRDQLEQAQRERGQVEQVA